jgi:hypothetical protein
MAVKSVVTNRFFQRVLPVLERIDKSTETGPLTLAMLVPSSVNQNFRSLVLSSPGLDELGLSRATTIVLERLRSELGNDAHKIDTVSILKTNNSAVRMISEAYDIDELGTPYEMDGAVSLALGISTSCSLIRHSRGALG